MRYMYFILWLAGWLVSTVGAETGPRNVVLVIGDGMGFDQVLAGRIHRGALEERLAMEKMPVSGVLSTFAVGEERITDSAASATAMATGHKTSNGRIATTPDGVEVTTLYEELRQRNYALGIITDGDLNGATAGAFTAHADSREEKAKISGQMIKLAPDFMLGTADGFFFPENEELTIEKARADGISVYMDVPIETIKVGEEPMLVGYMAMIAEDPSIAEQKVVRGKNAPSLEAATHLGLEKLTKNTTGFFLLLEGDWIDSWGHDNEFELVGETVSELDKAVEAVLEFARADGETLVVVTADHECGGLTLVEINDQGVKPHFSTKEHTASAVPVFAYGPGSERFSGSLDNTEIYHILKKLLMESEDGN